MFTKWFKHFVLNQHPCSYLVVVGSTFRGFDKRATGVAISFDLTQQQSHANVDHLAARAVSEGTLGRDTFYGSLDTRCGAVGSSVKEFRPGAFVDTIGGAIVFGDPPV
jgi:hypothetical protein